MSRENETYRLELEQLMVAFTQQAVINRTELMRYLHRGRTWLDSHGFTGNNFTLVSVAHKLSKLK